MPKGPLRDADLADLVVQRENDTRAQKGPPRSRWSAGWLLAGAILLVAAGFWTTRLPFGAQIADMVREKSSMAPRAPPLPTQIIAEGSTANGYVVPTRQASVASKGTGRLEYLGVAVGDRVKAGQIIARIEHGDALAALLQSKAKVDVSRAALATAQAELRDATLNYERTQTLLAQQFLSQSEFDSAEARFNRATAAINSAEAAIKAALADEQAAEVLMENTRILSPFDGIVLKKFAEVGEVVAPFAASPVSRGAVVLIADLTTLFVEAEVSESMIGRLRTGQPADIRLDAVRNHVYRGAVAQIIPTADRSKATVLAKVRLLDPDAFVLPEMSAKVTFVSEPVEEKR